MARPNFHDRSWQDIDWETWGPQFSIVDRASSVRELQNGIGTRYMEVQDLLSQLPPHAGKAKAMVALWRHEVSGYGRTITFSESNRVLRRLDDLYGQVSAHLQSARQAAKAAGRASCASAARRRRPARRRAPARAAWPVRTPTSKRMTHSAATSRQRSDDPRPGHDTAAWPWRAVQPQKARECDASLPDTANPVSARQFRIAVEAVENAPVEQFQHVRENSMVRILVAGKTQFWTTGLPNLEQLGIARFSIYRREGHSKRFEYVAGIRRPEDAAAEREAAERRARTAPAIGS